MRTALLVLWAVVATVFAVLGQLQEPPPGRSEAARGAYRERERASRLERKVRELEAALAQELDPAPEEDRDDLAMLVAADRILQEDENWTAEKAQAISRKIYARVAADAAAHLELVRLLKDAADPDRILGYLLENPFAGLVRSAEVTKAIREEARALLVAPEPHKRIAGVRVLYGYEPPPREDLLLGIARLGVDPDEAVREEIVYRIADVGPGVDLTLEDARPFLERLREGVDRDETWYANMLADWSAEPEDFERIKAAFLRDPSRETLNAFRRDSRLAGPRVDECRALLVGMLEDPDTGDLALHLLMGYAPWDRETAAAVTRATR